MTARGIFHGMLVCTTGIPPSERARVETIVSRLGGASSEVLLDATTHLVVGRVGSAKHVAAVQHGGITPVTIAFIEACTAANQLLREDPFLPPALLGLRLAVAASSLAVARAVSKRLGVMGASVVELPRGEAKEKTASSVDALVVVDATAPLDTPSPASNKTALRKGHVPQTAATSSSSPAAPHPTASEVAELVSRARDQCIPVVSPDFIQYMQRGDCALEIAIAKASIRTTPSMPKANVLCEAARITVTEVEMERVAAATKAPSSRQLPRASLLPEDAYLGPQDSPQFIHAVQSAVRDSSATILLAAWKGNDLTAARRLLLRLGGMLRVPCITSATTHVVVHPDVSRNEAVAWKQALKQTVPWSRILSAAWLHDFVPSLRVVWTQASSQGDEEASMQAVYDAAEIWLSIPNGAYVYRFDPDEAASVTNVCSRSLSPDAAGETSMNVSSPFAEQPPEQGSFPVLSVKEIVQRHERNRGSSPHRRTASPLPAPVAGVAIQPPRRSSRIRKIQVSRRPGTTALFSHLHIVADDTMGDEAKAEVDVIARHGGGFLASSAAQPAPTATSIVWVMPHAGQRLWDSGPKKTPLPQLSTSPVNSRGLEVIRVTVDWLAAALSRGELVDPQSSYVFTVTVVPVTPEAALQQAKRRRRRGCDDIDNLPPVPSPYLLQLRYRRDAPGVHVVVCTSDGLGFAHDNIIRDLGGVPRRDFSQANTTHIVLPSGDPLGALDQAALRKAYRAYTASGSLPVGQDASSIEHDDGQTPTAAIATWQTIVRAAVEGEAALLLPPDNDAPPPTLLVHLQWLADSARAGYFVDEAPYTVPFAAVLAMSRDADAASTVSHAATSLVYHVSSTTPRYVQTAAAVEKLETAGLLRRCDSVGAADIVVADALEPRESILVAISFGKLLVTSAFATVSEARGVLVSPEEYEWTTEALPADAKQVSVHLAPSCRHFRLRREQGKPGPFAEWAVAFWSSTAEATLADIVAAGGAVVLNDERLRGRGSAAAVYSFIAEAVSPRVVVVCAAGMWAATGSELTALLRGDRAEASGGRRSVHFVPQEWVLRVLQQRSIPPLHIAQL